MKKIIILDFESGKVLIKSYDSLFWENDEDFLIDLGLRPKNCEWMIVDELKLKIE